MVYNHDHWSVLVPRFITAFANGAFRANTTGNPQQLTSELAVVLPTSSAAALSRDQFDAILRNEMIQGQKFILRAGAFFAVVHTNPHGSNDGFIDQITCGLCAECDDLAVVMIDHTDQFTIYAERIGSLSYAMVNGMCDAAKATTLLLLLWQGRVNEVIINPQQ